MRLSHLRNWKVENFFEIRRQTSKKGVKTPVVAEMCDNYPPHGWRSEDFKPWGVIFLKKINNVVRGVTYFKTWKNPCHSSSLPPTSQTPFNQNLLFKFRQLSVSNRPAIPKILERRGQPREVYQAFQKILPGSFSRVLPTSRVRYHAGKPIEIVVYHLNTLQISQLSASR